MNELSVKERFNLPIPTSPLKQINELQSIELKPKLLTTWLELTSNSNLFLNQNQTSNFRFFNDLFCLSVNDSNIILNCLSKLTVKDLLGPFKNNMTQLFTNSIKLLKETQKGDVIRTNIIDTLIPFLRNVLSRKYPNFSFEVMNLLAGSLERSDSVFTDLVSAIDIILQDTTAPPSLRSKTLQLSIIIVASINQASLNAYFLRRDLFSTLTRYISTPTISSTESFNATILLGLLANFRKLLARNPYQARIEDFVDDFVMGIIVDVVKNVAKDSVTTGYSTIVGNGPAGVAGSDESKIGFVASFTSLVYGSLELLRGGFSLSLPPPVVSSRASSKGKGKEKALSQDGTTEEEESKGEKSLSVGESNSSTATSSSGDLGEKDGPTETMSRLTLDLPPPLPPKITVDSSSSSSKSSKSSTLEKKEESSFKSMPPEVTVILLPFYDLLNSNKAFCTVVYADTETGPAELPPALIALSSYILCHASVSLRSRVYARLCLIILTILVEEGEGKLTVEAEEIKLCRQRLPMLPLNQGRRPPIAAVLDTALIFLRHNMHKRLDVESYIICLKLVQRVMQQLKNERVRLEYDWVAIWRSILSLSAFIVSKHDDLRVVSTQLDDLISQIFIVLSYAVFWGETFFATTSASVLLHYELLHSDQTLSSLVTLLEVSSLTARKIASPILSPSPNIPRRLSINANQFYYSSTSTGPTGSSFQATECITNLRSCIDFFSEELIKEKERLRSSNKLGNEEELEVEVVMMVIEKQLSKVDLAECLAMGDLRRWEELGMGQETFFKELAAVACEDSIRLIPVV